MSGPRLSASEKAALAEPFNPADFVEVQRPETESAAAAGAVPEGDEK